MLIRSYRSILALMLALVTTCLVSCGSPAATAPPPAYTSQQVEQIQRTVSNLSELREKMPVLKTKIDNRDWVDVSTYIHGPLGSLRRTMSYLTRQLVPQDQKAASEAADDLFEHLQQINTAAENRNYQLAANNYQEALIDFDRFLKLIPDASNVAGVT
jgi:photosystem II protein PsbQ